MKQVNDFSEFGSPKTNGFTTIHQRTMLNSLFERENFKADHKDISRAGKKERNESNLDIIYKGVKPALWSNKFHTKIGSVRRDIKNEELGLKYKTCNEYIKSRKCTPQDFIIFKHMCKFLLNRKNQDVLMEWEWLCKLNKIYKKALETKQC